MADLEARQRSDEQIQQKDAELREAKAKFDREIAKLEQGKKTYLYVCVGFSLFVLSFAAVAAIQSGRGRLEQLQELQAEHSKKEQALEEKIAEVKKRKSFSFVFDSFFLVQLNEQVEALSSENEALAESNAAMVAAMEGAGADVSDALGSKMDAKVCFLLLLLFVVHGLLV